MIEVSCPTEADTRAVARKLAAILRPGDIVLLAGRLGSGKTLFTSGLADGLGIEEQVVSPSFVLVRQYRSGFMPMVHADVYRLRSIHEFDDLDVFELAADGVLVVEWGDAVESAMPDSHLRVEFAVEEDGTRVLAIVPLGDWSNRDLAAVA